MIGTKVKIGLEEIRNGKHTRVNSNNYQVLRIYYGLEITLDALNVLTD